MLIRTTSQNNHVTCVELYTYVVFQTRSLLRFHEKQTLNLATKIYHHGKDFGNPYICISQCKITPDRLHKTFADQVNAHTMLWLCTNVVIISFLKLGPGSFNHYFLPVRWQGGSGDCLLNFSTQLHSGRPFRWITRSWLVGPFLFLFSAQTNRTTGRTVSAVCAFTRQ